MTDMHPFQLLLLTGVPLTLALAAFTQLLHQRLDFSATRLWIAGHFPLYLAGTLPLMGLLAFFYGATGSLAAGCCITLLLAAFLAYANFLMLRYREQTIVPRDIAMALNLNRLLTMISPASCLIAVLGLMLAGAGALLLHRLLPAPAPSPMIRILLLLTGAAVLVMFGFAGRKGNPARRLLECCGGRFDPHFHSGNTSESFRQNGFIAAFLSLCGHPVMEKPPGYSREAVEEIVSRYTPLAEAYRKEHPSTRSAPPHILYIMSEAFSDPTILPGLSFSQDPIPQLRRIGDACISGKVLAPGYGGGTAHCEFEALTGFSVAFTGGISPFENNVNRQATFPALPRRLLERGYRTLALHPYKRGMYARTTAYPAMGLERFIDVTGMTHTGMPDRNPYVGDAAAYEEAWELLTGSSQPLFLHLVTMQNHGDYSQKNRFSGGPAVGGLARLSDNLGVETYARGIHRTDRDTAEFLERLAGYPEDVMVVFWGDHLPGVYPEGFIKENIRLRYETPFFLWANFPLTPAQLGTRSPMMLPALLAEAAGLPATPHDMLLQAVQRELHGIHERFLVDAEDRVISREGMPPQAASLLEQLRIIQYDAMLGGRYADAAGFFQSVQ